MREPTHCLDPLLSAFENAHFIGDARRSQLGDAQSEIEHVRKGYRSEVVAIGGDDETDLVGRFAVVGIRP